jgi:hypothetical protein
MTEFLIVVLLMTISFNFISYFILPFNVRKILDELVETRREMKREMEKTRKILEEIEYDAKREV